MGKSKKDSLCNGQIYMDKNTINNDLQTTSQTTKD